MEEASSAVTEQTPRSSGDLFGGGMMSPVRDVHSVYARLRRERPVEFIKSDLGETWLITRYDDVNRVLRERATRVIDEAIDTLIDDCVRGGSTDLVSQFTLTFPIRVIAHVRRALLPRHPPRPSGSAACGRAALREAPQSAARTRCGTEYCRRGLPLTRPTPGHLRHLTPRARPIVSADQSEARSARSSRCRPRWRRSSSSEISWS
jgi:hypothetical protein